jgi:hypothetical protein
MTFSADCRQSLFRYCLYSSNNIDSDVVCRKVLLQRHGSSEGAMLRDYTRETNFKDDLSRKVCRHGAVIRDDQQIYPAFFRRVELRLVQREKVEGYIPR